MEKGFKFKTKVKTPTGETIFVSHNDPLITEKDFNYFLEADRLSLIKSHSTSKVVKPVFRNGRYYLQAYYISNNIHTPQEEKDSLKFLQSHGITTNVKPGGLEFFSKNFPNFDIVQFITDQEEVAMAHIVPHLKSTEDNFTSTVTFEPNSTKFEFTCQSKGITYLHTSRILQVRGTEKTLYNDSLVIAKELRGKGIAKELYRRLYSTIKSAGILRITLTAGETDQRPINGANTWGLFGFKCSRGDIDNIVLNSFNYCGGSSYILGYKDKDTQRRIKISQKDCDGVEKLVNDFYSKNSENTPYPLTDIYDFLGMEKALVYMGFTEWNGELSMSDSAAVQVFERKIS